MKPFCDYLLLHLVLLPFCFGLFEYWTQIWHDSYTHKLFHIHWQVEIHFLLQEIIRSESSSAHQGQIWCHFICVNKSSDNVGIVFVCFADRLQSGCSTRTPKHLESHEKIIICATKL